MSHKIYSSKEHAVNHPFDSLFKNFMSRPNRAIDFFELFVPKNIFSLVKKEEFILCPQSFVDNKLKHKHVDVLYQTKFKDASGYIYFLAEEQTEPDKNMPFRIWQYVLRIIEHHQKQFKDDTFPIIYPIVFSVGKTAYPFSTDFFDGFGEHKVLAKSIFTNPFKVADVVDVNDEEVQIHPFAGALSRIYQAAHARDIIEALQKMRPQIYHLDQIGDSDFIVSMLYFALDRTEDGDADTVIETVQSMVSKQTESQIMTLAQQLKNKAMQQGIQQGMQQGMQQGISIGYKQVAKNMLLRGEHIQIIAKDTGLSMAEIQILQRQLEDVNQ